MLDNAHAEHKKKLGLSKKENPSKRFKQLPVAPEEQGQPPMIMMLMMKPVI